LPDGTLRFMKSIVRRVISASIRRALLEVVDDSLAALLALAALHDVLEARARSLRRGLGRPERFVGRARDAIPLVEALVVRQSPLFAAQVPLAAGRGRVAGAREQLGDRHFPLRQTFDTAADRDRVSARADREATGQDRRATRRALRLDVEVREPRAFRRELVDARRRRAAQDAAAVAAHLAVAEVVHQDEDDVGLRRRRRRLRRRERRERGGQCEPREPGSHR
jgi:hypothetical protein